MDLWGTIPDMVTSVLTVAGIAVGLLGLRQNQKLRQAEFIEQIEKEYRDLIKDIPYEVFSAKGLPDNELDNYRRIFFRYFDFTNGEILLRKNHRIEADTWENWNEGIRGIMEKPAFKKAFEEILKDTSGIFTELKKLRDEEYATDPVKWK